MSTLLTNSSIRNWFICPPAFLQPSGQEPFRPVDNPTPAAKAPFGMATGESDPSKTKYANVFLYNGTDAEDLNRISRISQLFWDSVQVGS